uniref:Superkiller complex protein 8 n=1 Tax=Cyprinus carpio carpio TaxID=630221 RepID=A0A8C1DWP9_CYPCA
MDAGPVDAWTVAFSPDSRYIATGSHLGKVNIFGVESGKKEHSLDTRGKFILSIAYSPDGKYLASGAIDGIINIFDIATGKLLHTLEGENRLPRDSSHVSLLGAFRVIMDNVSVVEKPVCVSGHPSRVVNQSDSIFPLCLPASLHRSLIPFICSSKYSWK